MKIHHVGIAVESLRSAVPIFEKLLARAPRWEETVHDQKVQVAVFELEGSRIELLEATAADSPVARFVSKRGQGIHHLTLTVPDISKSLAELAAVGISPIDQKPRTGAAQERIAFLDPRSTCGVLIELVEEK